MTMYIIAGANGSGKTTFAKSFAKFNNLAFINADEIAKDLNPQNIEKEKIKAGKIFLKDINAQIAKQSDFICETTMSGKYLLKIIEKAKQADYEVVIFYLYLDSVIDNIARVQNRVYNGGHNVPRGDIIRRFSRSKELFWNVYKNYANSWFLFFNSDDEFEEVANYGDNELTILHEIYFNKFTQGLK